MQHTERPWDGTPVRYPDPAIEIHDPRFAPYRLGNAAVERLWTGARWTEGPVYFGINKKGGAGLELQNIL